MSTNHELDLQFSPRMWAKRAPPEKIVQMHIDFVTKVSETVKRNIPNQLNVAYGPSTEEKLDIYGIDLPPNSPILVYIHGGYWQQLNKDISSFSAESFYKYGVKVIVVGYTLCPNCSLNKIVEEIESAFLACLEYAKKCGSKGIYICGHSAGAHLAAILFRNFFHSLPQVDQKYLKAVYYISGVFDLVPIVETYVNDALKLTPTVANDLSPLNQPIQADNDIAFFVIVGEYESPTFHEQSKAFYEKLRNYNYTAKFIQVPSVDHFDIVENLSNANHEIFKILANAIQK